MISVVPEEEEEDINMESYGEEGYEHGYEGEYTDKEGEEAPNLSTPQPTRATNLGRGITMDSTEAPPLNPSPRIQWRRPGLPGNWW